MIDVVYTGDVRHNQKIRSKNHNMFLDRLNDRVNNFFYPHRYNKVVHEFYNGKGEKKFLPCPFNRGGNDAYWHPDNLRRGQGGGVQIWQFINAVRLTKNPYIIRLRNDIWFTKSSIDVIMKELDKILKDENDIAYFGSNWLEGNMGVEYQVIEKFKGVEDFIIIAKRESLLSYEETLAQLNKLGRNHLRSGNKCFKYISKSKRKRKVLCRLYLTRQTYKDYPSDKQVCYDYLVSYCTSRDGLSKMGPAFDWFENYEPWKNIKYKRQEEVRNTNGYRVRLYR